MHVSGGGGGGGGTVLGVGFRSLCMVVRLLVVLYSATYEVIQKCLLCVSGDKGLKRSEIL